MARSSFQMKYPRPTAAVFVSKKGGATVVERLLAKPTVVSGASLHVLRAGPVSLTSQPIQVPGTFPGLQDEVTLRYGNRPEGDTGTTDEDGRRGTLISLLGGSGEVTVSYGIPYEMSLPATGIEDYSSLKVPVATSSDTTKQQTPRDCSQRQIAQLSKN